MDLESSQEMSTILPSSTMDEEEFDVIIDIPELDGLEILPGVPIVVENLETNEPRLRIGDALFIGKHHQTIGTQVIVSRSEDVNHYGYESLLIEEKTNPDEIFPLRRMAPIVKNTTPTDTDTDMTSSSSNVESSYASLTRVIGMAERKIVFLLLPTYRTALNAVTKKADNVLPSSKRTGMLS